MAFHLQERKINKLMIAVVVFRQDIVIVCVNITKAKEEPIQTEDVCQQIIMCMCRLKEKNNDNIKEQKNH